MAVYYKFKSAKDFDTIPIDGHFVSVAILKEKIFDSKHLGRGTDYDLVVTNVQTGEEYLDEETLIPKGTSVLIRRVPGRPRMTIVAQQQPTEENKVVVPEPPNCSFTGAESSTMKYPDENDWDEFGSDLYAIPEMSTVQFTNISQDAPPPTKEDEDSKIQALIETPALDWQQPGDGYGSGRGFIRGGRMMGGRGFGRLGLGPDKRTPPPGYVCHRCKVPGHFIQHCPTNGDPNYDVKKVKPPTGIPKSMLIETPDGSYALPSGSVGVLKPNEAAFEKEIDGLPTTRSVGEIPAEHRCPLCKEIMKDAVITVKCCFATFCDQCIRDHIISKSACVCGQKDVLTDDLIPNKLARDSISRFLECNNNSSAENQGSTYQVQDVESARCPPATPTLSAASRGEHLPVVEEQNTPKLGVDEDQTAAPHQTAEIAKSSSKVAASEATHESASAKEPASQASAPHAEEEVQQKATAETGKKIKKKKARASANAAEVQWKNVQEFGADNYMMPPMGPAGFNPYWNGMQPGMQPGMEAYMPPFGGPMPFMGGYPLGPMDMSYGGFMPPDPYAAAGLMYPPLRPQHPQHPHPRDRPDFGMGFNGGPPPAMSREEFEARKADLRRKREVKERRAGSMRGGDLPPRNCEASKDTSGAAKPKSSAEEHDRNHHSHHGSSSSSRHRSSPPRHTSSTYSSRHSPPPNQSHGDRDVELPRPPKRKSSERDRERDYDVDRRRRDHHHSEKQRHHRSESADRKSPGGGDSAAGRAVAKSDSSVKPSHMESKSSSAATAAEVKSKASVFARISFPDEAGSGSKKKKTTSSISTGKGSSMLGGGADSSTTLVTSSGGTKRKSGGSLSEEYYAESSDEDRHFKRKPSRYEASPVDPDSRYTGSRSHRR